MANWWNDFTSAVGDIVDGTTPTNPVSNWLGSMGGSIASGIEGGVVAFLKDLWDLIIGPLEVITGIVIILIAFGILIRGDVLGAIMPQGRI